MESSEKSIRLVGSQRIRLEKLIRKGALSPREHVRAQVLLLSNKKWSKESITEACGASRATIGRVRSRFRSRGIDGAIWEGKRAGAPAKITPSIEQRVVALACTQPPEGSSRWTVRLLAEEAVRRRITASLGRERVRMILQDHDLKPWRQKNVVHS